MNLFKSIQLAMSTIQDLQCKGAFLCIVPFKFNLSLTKNLLNKTYAVMFHYFTKVYNQMKQMTSVLFSYNICVMHVTEIKCILHML